MYLFKFPLDFISNLSSTILLFAFLPLLTITAVTSKVPFKSYVNVISIASFPAEFFGIPFNSISLIFSFKDAFSLYPSYISTCTIS